MQYRIAVLALGFAAALGPWPVTGAVAQQSPIVLIPHRAIYDLELAGTRGNSQISSVEGRIVYDFSGSICEGYGLNFRQVSELNSGEGKSSRSDLRSTTWESADGKSFKFTSENRVDENPAGTAEGHAEKSDGKTTIFLDQPQRKTFTLAGDLVFPTEHMVRAIKAAQLGTAILNFPTYDGSETGEKVFDTLTVIGRPIAPSERPHNDAMAGNAALEAVPRWPVTISYFGRDKQKEHEEQTPDYAISFELYANGISRALKLDYNDFIINGKLTSFELKQPTRCP